MNIERIEKMLKGGFVIDSIAKACEVSVQDVQKVLHEMKKPDVGVVKKVSGNLSKEQYVTMLAGKVDCSPDGLRTVTIDTLKETIGLCFSEGEKYDFPLNEKATKAVIATALDIEGIEKATKPCLIAIARYLLSK